MSSIIQPFKCEDVLVKLGTSCEKQKEIYGYLHNLQTGVTTLAPNSVAIGSGLGDASWNEALNYGKIQEVKNKEIIKEAEVKSVGYISNLQTEKKKKDYMIYGVAILLVLGVIVYEFKSSK
jgi:hypothetical protein